MTSQPQDAPEGAVPGRRKMSWVNSVFPYNIAIGPISTIIQLYIIEFHGTVLDVGLAVTLFNGVSIPAAIVWGFVTDRFHRRKSLIIASYLAVAGILVSFLFVRTVYGVSLLYAAFALVSTASATPLNLLIMETERKPKWATAFARFSMVTSIGQILGLVLSVGWSSSLPLEYLGIPLAALSVISAVLSSLLIKEPSFVFERQMIALQKRSFFERLLSIPFFFLRVPRVSDFRKVFRGLRYELTRHVPLLYSSIFVFYLASGIFNTSIVPAFKENGISDFLILAVTTLVMLVQTLTFRYAGAFIERRSPVSAATAGLALRSLNYGLLGASAYLLTGIWFLLPSLLFYPLASGVAYAIYYIASNTMVFNTLGGRSQGSSLGVYSALVGMATMAGSLISGFLSFYFGYYATFIVAALCLVVSISLSSPLSHPQTSDSAHSGL